MPTSLTFQDHSLEIISHRGNDWIKGGAICATLGYKNPESALKDLYQRHKNEFTPSMVQKICISTNGGEQEVLAFSLRGAHLLAIFSRTPVSAQFRKWVLDVLEEKRAAPKITQKHPLPHNQAIEDRRALEEHYIITGGDAMVDIQHISVRLDSLSMILEKIPEFNAAWMTLLEKLLKEARDYSLKVETSLLNIQHSKTATELQARGKRALGI